MTEKQKIKKVLSMIDRNIRATQNDLYDFSKINKPDMPAPLRNYINEKLLNHFKMLLDLKKELVDQ